MPLTLTQNAFREPSNFLKLLARTLDSATLEHEFEDSPQQAAVDAPSEFQNENSGLATSLHRTSGAGVISTPTPGRSPNDSGTAT
ncbi:MAG TPA: hypothetical protein DGB32_10380 [Dehalococcoidia bacterium]|jgi:hypothetical protein|nr:hypothetical protein [Chloroflexota bacterium]HCV28721.1 hypothetical protein [Dehalococcoidia bacterium]